MSLSKRSSPKRGDDAPSPKVFTNKRTRTITYIGEINWEGAGDFLQQLEELATKKDPMTFQLCTEGGDVEPGMAMYSAIKRFPGKTTGVVIGTCQSMGTVILQAAKMRLIHLEATMMHHTGTTSNGAALSAEEHESSAVFDLSWTRNIDRIVFNRTKGRFCKTWESFARVSASSVWLTAAQAVKLGFADGYR